VLCSALKAIS
jgi:hypothetical protein